MAKQTYDSLKPTHNEFFRFLTESPAVELAYRLINLSDIPLDRDRLSVEALAGFIVMKSVLRRLGRKNFASYGISFEILGSTIRGSHELSGTS